MYEENIINSLIDKKENKGKGAGGKNTNLKGKFFEEYTDLQVYLFDYLKYKINDTKYGYFLQKISNNEGKEIFYTFLFQSGFKTYFKKYYDIDFFRFPDEAFIIQSDELMNIYIIEKKEQSVEGSVETKLWSCPGLKREYEIIIEDKFRESNVKYNIKFHYILCISHFLENKFKTNIKYKILKRILNENDIYVLYGDSETYFNELKRILGI